VSLSRAAASGHAWLARLPAKGHAGHVVEPALLASVRPPPVMYVPAIPRRLAKTGVLSELQLEAMLHAGQCHAQPLRPNGSRPGFLLADGAGVGKGRTQAAILLDAWLQGHQKAVWVSASADLFADARRDLEAVCTAIPGTPPLHKLLTNLTSVHLSSSRAHTHSMRHSLSDTHRCCCCATLCVLPLLLYRYLSTALYL